MDNRALFAELAALRARAARAETIGNLARRAEKFASAERAHRAEMRALAAAGDISHALSSRDPSCVSTKPNAFWAAR